VYEYDNAEQLRHAYEKSYASTAPPGAGVGKRYYPSAVDGQPAQGEGAAPPPARPASVSEGAYAEPASIVPASTYVPEPPMVLPRDVVEIPARNFCIPMVTNGSVNEIDLLTVYFSRDRGKTWLPHMSVPPTAQEVAFSVDRDGEYWFALRVVYKDGRMEPSKIKDLVAMQKVYVNGQRRPVK
jgi:hypothetical protein